MSINTNYIHKEYLIYDSLLNTTYTVKSWFPWMCNPWMSPHRSAQITTKPLADNSIASICDSKQTVLHSIVSSFSNRNKLFSTLTIILCLRTIALTDIRPFNYGMKKRITNNIQSIEQIFSLLVTGPSGVNLKWWFLWNTFVIVSSSQFDGTKFQFILNLEFSILLFV